MHNTYTLGQWAENMAFEYLKKQGLKPLERNFQGPGGEIDLIMQDKKVIAFVEVRYRANDHFVSALESIDQQKCARIINTSQYYLQSNRLAFKQACRFDVVIISGPTDKPKIEWIKNAFQA